MKIDKINKLERKVFNTLIHLAKDYVCVATNKQIGKLVNRTPKGVEIKIRQLYKKEYIYIIQGEKQRKIFILKRPKDPSKKSLVKKTIGNKTYKVYKISNISREKQKEKFNKKYRKYIKYLNSEQWKKKRIEFITKYKKCEKCQSTINLELHHKNYKSLFKEKEKDLALLCSKCHFEYHKHFPKATKQFFFLFKRDNIG